MSNVVNFPLKGIFERDVFDRSQSKSKEIATECVLNSETIEEYVLSLAMALGHSMSYIREEHPDIYEELNDVFLSIADGGGLSYE